VDLQDARCNNKDVTDGFTFAGVEIYFCRCQSAVLHMKFGCLCTDMTEGSEM